MKDIFYYYQNKISRCLSKSEIYVLQDKIVEEKGLTEEQKDELLDFSWEEIDIIDEYSHGGNFYEDEFNDCIEEDD